MAQQVEAHMSLTLDGFGTGFNQSLTKPFGDADGEALHRWLFEDAGNNRAEIDKVTAYGAFIMGRNMFGVGDGPIDPNWKGWWGPNPPYHAPVYVLTHYARPTLDMEGGTSFHFITEGPDIALELARQAAGSRNVAIAGGVSTLRHYLNTAQVDRFHLSLTSLLFGAGERLWDGLEAELRAVSARHTTYATHIEYVPARYAALGKPRASSSAKAKGTPSMALAR